MKICVSAIYGTPHERQERFLLDQNKWAEYFGERGEGKSLAVRIKATLLALTYPESKILICNKTEVESRVSIIGPSKEEYKKIPESIRPTYCAPAKTYRFPNGSEIHCKHCETVKDAERYRGLQYDYIFIDNAHRMGYVQVSAIIRHIRGVKRYYLTYAQQ